VGVARCMQLDIANWGRSKAWEWIEVVYTTCEAQVDIYSL